MFRNWWLIGIIFLFPVFIYAQEDEPLDSIDILGDFVGLEGVVITGQFSAQSINKSIYQVEVISQEDIKNQAGNTVADILSQTLNILIIPDGKSGDSQVNIMGLDGGYTKILIDNIPVIGDGGLGNNIDLTKINLDNVERIEVVKGAMGVDYGNNALAGVINIITKKSIRKKWRVSATLQEESVGNEYDWYKKGGTSKGKGRHIQALEISHNISDKWFASVSSDRNDFMGYWGKMQGKNHIDRDERRGYEWLPKLQLNGNALLSFKSNGFKAFYKLNFLEEESNFYSPTVTEEPLEGNDRTYIAENTDYKTHRWLHQLNIDTKFFNRIKYIGDFSYQSQNRKSRKYMYDVPNRRNYTDADYETFAKSEAFYSRGTFSKFLRNDWIDFQVGYELESTKGYRSSLSGLFKNDIDETIATYAGFASAEIHPANNWSFRPGFRASFSNTFDNQFNFSLSTKYDIKKDNSLRFVVGTANRFPNFDELFTYFVDTNHDVRGNEDLKPEKGYSTSLQWNHRLSREGFKMNNNLTAIFIDNSDRIELAVVNERPIKYKYINVDRYRAWGLSTSNRFSIPNVDLSLGASLMGTSKGMKQSEESGLADDFLYSFEVNASVNYKIPKWDSTLSLYYKYTGPVTEYVMSGGLNDILEGGITDVPTEEEITYRLGKRSDFSLLNFSARKDFFNDKLEVTLGVRNIFDVSELKSSTDTGGVTGTGHGGAQSQQGLFYGRSYFLKLNYILDF